MPNLFSVGVVIIPPDKETSLNPYVPGVIMDAKTGAVVGVVPNSVSPTSDGCVFSDGTMVFNDHLAPFNIRGYDTNFNQLWATSGGFGGGVDISPPAPASDFTTWVYYAQAGNAGVIKRTSKAGVPDGLTFNLSGPATAFAPDPTSTYLYWFDGSGAIQSWNLLTNSPGPTVLAAASLPAHYGTGVTIRVVPKTGNILAMMNFIVSSFDEHLEVWQIAGLNSVTPAPGTVITKTVLTGQPGNTDPTMQIDVGTPNTAFVVRSYPGDNDRQDGCIFNQVRISDGAILNSFPQTIAEADDGVPGGILPATCPLVSWSQAIVPQRPGCPPLS